MKTFAIWEPGEGEETASILDEFVQHQKELKEVVREFSGRLDFVISSPANQHIVYTLGQAFEILVAHERRHLEQARELRDCLVRRQTT